MSFVGETLLEERPTFRSGAGPVASGREAGCGVCLGQKGRVVLTDKVRCISPRLKYLPSRCGVRGGKPGHSFPGKCGSFGRKRWSGKLVR